MNTQVRLYELELHEDQVVESLESILHTVLFHRCEGKYRCKPDGRYEIGSLGYEDVDCSSIHLTYLRCSDPDLVQRLHKDVTEFAETLRPPSKAQICLEFLQQSRNAGTAPTWQLFREPGLIPWEIWTVRLRLLDGAAREHQRRELGERIADILLDIAQYMNERENYLPRVPDRESLHLVFDTGFQNLQPYRFRISHSLDVAATTAADAVDAAPLVEPVPDLAKVLWKKLMFC